MVHIWALTYVIKQKELKRGQYIIVLFINGFIDLLINNIKVILQYF